MRCYHHPLNEAVGICKSCQKALCPECAVDVGKGLACGGSCEEDVRALNATIASSVRNSPVSSSLVSTARRTGIIQGSFFLVMGALFALWGSQSGGMLAFATVAGVAFMAYGVFFIIRAYRLGSVPPNDPRGTAPR